MNYENYFIPLKLKHQLHVNHSSMSTTCYFLVLKQELTNGEALMSTFKNKHLRIKKFKSARCCLRARPFFDHSAETSIYLIYVETHPRRPDKATALIRYYSSIFNI